MYFRGQTYVFLWTIPRQDNICVDISDIFFLQDDSFDAVLSIAVIHHIATTERRVRALRELARVSLDDDDDCDDVNIDYFKHFSTRVQVDLDWDNLGAGNLFSTINSLFHPYTPLNSCFLLHRP